MRFQKMNREIFGIILSFLLWYIVFDTQYLGSFWIRITVASITLSLYATFISKHLTSIKKWKIDLNIIFTGILSGLILYILFKEI